MTRRQSKECIRQLILFDMICGRRGSELRAARKSRYGMYAFGTGASDATPNRRLRNRHSSGSGTTFQPGKRPDRRGRRRHNPREQE